RHPRGEAGIRFGTRLTALAPHPEGPRARLQRSDGGEETVVARTVVGCDGADSTVRHLAGLGLEGERGLAHFRSVRFDAPLGEHV
ncbi:FAD-dependent monooxygenase, partial [Salmonella enterica]|nr:FAD-dependent monooxygenase [Salmonella enterica]